MAGLHATGRGTQVSMHKNIARQDCRQAAHDVRRAVTVFECIFCHTSHYVESASGSLQDAHKAISDILDSGCSKCGGRVTFKEHRHVVNDALSGRR